MLSWKPVTLDTCILQQDYILQPFSVILRRPLEIATLQHFDFILKYLGLKSPDLCPDLTSY